MYMTRTPQTVHSMVKSVLWRVPSNGTKKEVFLTFDDGPHPHLTPWVIEQLKEHGDLKATFFCVGNQAAKHPEIVKNLRSAGHEVANHSQGHESGWSTSNKSYLRSYLEFEEELGVTSRFRPPYGRITPNQARALSTRTQVVMWDVLSGDFDRSRSGVDCLKSLQKLTRPGSIVVFHDSEKAAPRLLYALPEYLKWLKKEGYTVQALPEKTEISQSTKWSGGHSSQAKVGLTDSL
jgi:peptidoglycan/xylan/chitin deacetylase (PgdA/CDA1 family)